MQHIPHRPHIPIGLLVAGAFVVLVPVIGCGAWLWLQWAALTRSAPWFVDTIRYSVFLLPLVFGAWGLGTVVNIAWRRYGWRESIFADKTASLAKAQRQFPDALTSLSFHDSHKSLPPLALPEQVSAPLAVPSFATMLDQGLVGPGRKLTLGYDEGGVLEGDWTDLYSTAVAGMSGQGKTTSQRFFACQTALHGSKFAVIDPHAGAGEDSLAATLAPLGSAFLCPIASDNKTMLDTVRHIADIGEKRIKGIDADTTPILLWVDELTSLLGRSAIGDELAELLERIAQEYRKKRVYVSASGQIWTASRATSELRDSFASVLCHRMKRGQARMLLPTDEAQLVERLSPGRAVLWRTSGATTIVGIPNTTEADVKRVATMIGSQAPVDMRSMAGSVPVTEKLGMGFHPSPKIDQKSTTANAVNTQALSAQIVPAEALRAHALFLADKDLTEIVFLLRGVKPKEGARYQQALKEIQALIRAAIQGGKQ
jgi:hypothetical protein